MRMRKCELLWSTPWTNCITWRSTKHHTSCYVFTCSDIFHSCTSNVFTSFIPACSRYNVSRSSHLIRNCLIICSELIFQYSIYFLEDPFVSLLPTALDNIKVNEGLKSYLTDNCMMPSTRYFLKPIRLNLCSIVLKTCRRTTSISTSTDPLAWRTVMRLQCCDVASGNRCRTYKSVIYLCGAFEFIIKWQSRSFCWCFNLSSRR